MHRTPRRAVAIAALIALATRLVAEAVPAAPAALTADDEAFLTREPATTFLVAQRDLTFAEIPAAAGELIPALDAEVHRLGLRANGRLVFAYRTPAEPAPGRVRLLISQPIDLGASEPLSTAAPFAIRHAPARRYLCLLHRGPIAGIGARWDELGRVAERRSLARGDESREVYLMWDAPDSAANLVLIEQAAADAEPATDAPGATDATDGAHRTDDF